MARTASTRVTSELSRSVRAALAALQRDDAPSDASVHDARRMLRRARAALRLLRPVLDRDALQREDAALRAVARTLGPMRDAEVRLGALAKFGRASAAVRSLELLPFEQSLRRELVAGRHRLRRSGRPMTRSTRDLTACLRRLDGALPSRVDREPLEKGFLRIYREARRRFAIAEKRTSPASLHAWRKQCKYLSNAIDLMPPDLGLRHARALERMKELADVLGRHHDLTMLDAGVATHGADLTGPAIRTLRAAIATRQQKLGGKALRLGRITFSSKASRLLE
ncbi:MAG TPA: CHAD domain-containing protein [Casimicrobiaceae bacterium]